MKIEKDAIKNVNKSRVLAFSLLLFTCPLLPCFAQNSGVIKELSGTVELKAPADSAFVAAKTGDQVGEDTVISTGFKSSAIVEVGSTLIAVRPLTRLTLTEIRSSAGAAETLNVNLQAGRIRVDVNPPAGTRASTTVSSPSATASVRGTSFDFDTMSVNVHEGTVSFSGSIGQTVPVGAGDSVALGETGKAANPVSTGSSAFKPQAPSGTAPGTAPVSIAATTGNPYANPPPAGPGPSSPGGPSGPSWPSWPGGPGGSGGSGGLSNPGSSDPDIPGIDVLW